MWDQILGFRVYNRQGTSSKLPSPRIDKIFYQPRVATWQSRQLQQRTARSVTCHRMFPRSTNSLLTAGDRWSDLPDTFSKSSATHYSTSVHLPGNPGLRACYKPFGHVRKTTGPLHPVLVWHVYSLSSSSYHHLFIT